MMEKIWNMHLKHVFKKNMGFLWTLHDFNWFHAGHPWSSHHERDTQHSYRLSGWWLTYPSEKYEFASWDSYYYQYMEKYKKCSKPPTSNPMFCPWLTRFNGYISALKHVAETPFRIFSAVSRIPLFLDTCKKHIKRVCHDVSWCCGTH